MISVIAHTYLSSAPEATLYKLYTQIDSMHVSVPLARLEFALATSNPEPETYLYKITLADGRLWRQRIDFLESPSDPKMTFNVDDEWKVSEFALNRPIRDSLVSLYTTIQLRTLDIMVT